MKASFSCVGFVLYLLSGSFYVSAEEVGKPPLYTVKIPQPYSGTPKKITICTGGDSSSTGLPQMGLYIDNNVSVIQEGLSLPAPGDCQQFSLGVPASQLIRVDITVKLLVFFSANYSKIGTVQFGSLADFQSCYIRIKYIYSFFGFTGTAAVECVAATKK